MQPNIRVKSGETFEVPFEVSAGTGFRWEVDLSTAAAKIIVPVAEDREVASTVPGGRTVQRFRFQALAAGKADLTFRYRRSWEAPDSGTLQTIAVQIDPVM
jgi:predicted secreted protein